MVSLGVHPSLSVKPKFWESRNVNGSDSVTQKYPEVCQQGHMSVMGHNIISLRLPGLSDSVSALINSGATSNFLDSSLATSPPFVLDPLDFLIALCLFNGKPVTAGFIHESVNISVSFADHLTQSLS